MSVIGYAPLHFNDATGDVSVDPSEAMVGDVDEGVESGRVYWPFGPRARARRFGRFFHRHPALAREAMAAEEGPAMVRESPADLYQAAAAQGMVQENQYDGLGATSIPAAVGAVAGVATLQDTVNRNLWAKSIVLDSDAPSQVTITAITIAGLPIQIGTQGAPLAMFATNSTRFGISFGRKLALVGQQIQVTLNNIDTGGAHTATGGVIADEMNPYAMQRLWEKMLLTAAVEYDGRF